MRYLIALFTIIATASSLSAQESIDPLKICTQKVGSLLFECYRFDAGRVIIGETKNDTIQCYNPTDKAIRIAIGELPEGLMARFDKSEIGPQQSAKLLISLYQDDPTKAGYYFQTFSLVENDEYVLYPYFSYTAKLEESFAHLTAAELEASPKIECLTPLIDFGTKGEGSYIKCSFVIKNIGKSDLEIYRISTSCGCTEATSDLMIIPPGKSTTISATFDSTSRYGKQIKTINIYNNSPLSPEYKLTITGTIE